MSKRRMGQLLGAAGLVSTFIGVILIVSGRLHRGPTLALFWSGSVIAMLAAGVLQTCLASTKECVFAAAMAGLVIAHAAGLSLQRLWPPREMAVVETYNLMNRPLRDVTLECDDGGPTNLGPLDRDESVRTVKDCDFGHLRRLRWEDAANGNVHEIVMNVAYQRGDKVVVFIDRDGKVNVLKNVSTWQTINTLLKHRV